MDSQTVTLTLPFTAQQFWVFTIALSLIALSAGIVYVAGKRVEKERLPKDWLRDSLMIAGGLLTPIWAALLFMVLSGLWHMSWDMPPPSPEGGAELRWHMLSIVALITSLFGILGAPLAMIRVVMTERQTRATEEGLITDRINKAVEGLGAVREVKKNDGASTEPNLEVRLGALYSLQRIAEDSPRDRGQILDMLCAYIRGNARVEDAELSPYQKDHTEKRTGRKTSKWLRGLAEPRTDISTAFTILKALIALNENQHIQVHFNRNLSKTNLRKSSLQDFDFTRWNLSGSYFDGCNVRDCVFAYSDLSETHWLGAEISQSQFIKNDLTNAFFCHATFQLGTEIELQSTHPFNSTEMIFCTFETAAIQSEEPIIRVHFDGSTFMRTTFMTTEFNLCGFRGSEFYESARPVNAIFHRCFFDAETEFPDMINTGNAFRSCDLTELQMRLDNAQHWFLAENTDLPKLISVDDAAQLREQQNKTGDFHHDWRAWQRSIGFQPDENQQ